MQSKYLERCAIAKETRSGDKWRNLKSGKTLEIISNNGYQADVKHESGRITRKQTHYLAGDYELIESNSQFHFIIF